MTQTNQPQNDKQQNSIFRDGTIYVIVLILTFGFTLAILIEKGIIYKEDIYTLQQDDLITENNTTYLILDNRKIKINNVELLDFQWGTPYRIKYVWNGFFNKGYGDITVIKPHKSETEKQATITTHNK